MQEDFNASGSLMTVTKNGTKEWRRDGQLHREDGPAYEGAEVAKSGTATASSTATMAPPSNVPTAQRSGGKKEVNQVAAVTAQVASDKIKR